MIHTIGEKLSEKLKNLNFIQILQKSVDHITLTLEIMQQLIIKPWRRSQSLLPVKIQRHEKIAIILKNCLNSWY